MKKTILLLATLISLAASAQLPQYELIFDFATQTSDSAFASAKIGRTVKSGSLNITYRFIGLNCTDAYLDCAAGLYDTVPSFAGTAGEITLPAQLDTTMVRPSPNQTQLLYSRYPVQGKNRWNFTVIYDKWNSYYTIEHVDRGSCTTGKIYRLY